MAALAVAVGRRPAKRPACDQAGPLAKIPRRCRKNKARHTIQNCFVEDPTKLPKYRRVADMIRADSGSETITAEKLVEMFSKCSLNLRVDVKLGRVQKKRQRTPFVCDVTCGNDCLGKARYWNKRGATIKAIQAACERMSGAPRFAALAKMVKEDSIDGDNVLEKLFAGFVKCRLEVDHKYRTLAGDKRTVHQCIVSCNGEVIGQEMAGSKKEAKKRSYEAIWNWLLSYPESP